MADKKKKQPSPTAALQAARAALITVTRGKTRPGHDQCAAALVKIDLALGVKPKGA